MLGEFCFFLSFLVYCSLSAKLDIDLYTLLQCFVKLSLIDKKSQLKNSKEVQRSTTEKLYFSVRKLPASLEMGRSSL